MKKVVIGLLAVAVCIVVVQANIRADEDSVFAPSEGVPVEEVAEEVVQETTSETEEAVAEEPTDLTEETELEAVEETTVEEAAEGISLSPTLVIENAPNDVIIVDKRVYLDMEKMLDKGV